MLSQALQTSVLISYLFAFSLPGLGEEPDPNLPTQSTRLPKSQGRPCALAYSQDGKEIFVATTSRHLYAWNLKSLKLDKVISFESGKITKILPTESGMLVVLSGGGYGLFDAEPWFKLVLVTHQPVLTSIVVYEEKKRISDVKSSIDGKSLVLARFETKDSILILSTETWRIARAFSMEDYPIAISIDKSGGVVSACSADIVRLWEIESGKQIWKVGEPPVENGVTGSDQPFIDYVSFYTQDKKRKCAVITANVWVGASLKIHDVDTGEVTQSIKLIEGAPDVILYPDRDILIAGGGLNSWNKVSNNAILRMWSLDSGSIVQLLGSGNNEQLCAIGADRAEKNVAAVTEKGNIHIWKIKGR